MNWLEDQTNIMEEKAQNLLDEIVNVNKPFPTGTGIMNQLSGTYTYTPGLTTWTTGKTNLPGSLYETVVSNPVERTIFPFREFLVYKVDKKENEYQLKTLDRDIPITLIKVGEIIDGPNEGIYPEQLLIVCQDFINNSELKDESLIQAEKHIRIALAYMEKFNMSLFKSDGSSKSS